MSEQDLTGELMECLDILREEHAYRSALTYAARDGGSDPIPSPPDFDEIDTAIWQTIELVEVLLQEHNAAWDALAALKAQAIAIRESVQSQLKLPSGGLMVP